MAVLVLEEENAAKPAELLGEHHEVTGSLAMLPEGSFTEPEKPGGGRGEGHKSSIWETETPFKPCRVGH